MEVFKGQDHLCVTHDEFPVPGLMQIFDIFQQRGDGGAENSLVVSFSGRQNCFLF